jgi:hypothetical protein
MILDPGGIINISDMTSVIEVSFTPGSLTSVRRVKLKACGP